MEIVGIKILNDDNIIKYIKSIKDMNKMLSIGEIRNKILNNEYVIKFDLIGDVNEQILSGNDQYSINLKFVDNLNNLKSLGAEIEIYLNDELITMEILMNQIESMRQIAKDVQEDIDNEVQSESTDD